MSRVTDSARGGGSSGVAGFYASGPGGIWILSSRGTHLGTIVAPEPPANFAWGDVDGRSLYMAAGLATRGPLPGE
jgi:hypothetical protein